MAEFVANAVQQVGINEPVLFTDSNPCRRGYVYHENETGIFILRGAPSSPCGCSAQYKITFIGNVAIPEGGTAGPIATAIAVNGEPKPTSRSIYTPAAVDTYGNVVSETSVTVPKGCCFSVSVRAVSASDDVTVTPAPAINVQNANLIISKTA